MYRDVHCDHSPVKTAGNGSALGAALRNLQKRDIHVSKMPNGKAGEQLHLTLDKTSQSIRLRPFVLETWFANEIFRPLVALNMSLSACIDDNAHAAQRF